MSNSLFIISCYFGKKEIEIHPAPLCRNCIFFSNNWEYAKQAREKGWVFEYVSKLISENSLVCSIQSKYIKFLIFLNDFPKYRKYSNILYFDHNLEVLESHVVQILDYHLHSGKSICIRQHENLSRTSVWDEIQEAGAQERYALNMDKTVCFIRNLRGEFGKVCNTGLILYRNDDRILPFLKEVYETCVMLEQPCCQIFWSVFSPKYFEFIQMISFHQLFPRNREWEKLGYFP